MSSNMTCSLLTTNSTRALVTDLANFTFDYFKPIALVLDIIGHILCFLAFYKKHKQNNLYSFQLYETMFKCLDTFGAFFNLFFYQLFAGTSGTPGALWYRTNYTLMWISAKLGITIYDMTTSMKLLASLAMAIDRCYALSRPMDYRNLNRLKLEGGAILATVTVGIAICLYGLFYYNIDQSNGVYSIVLNKDFTTSISAAALLIVRNVVYVISLVILIICNAQITKLHRQRNRKVANMTIAEQSKDAQRRNTEKTLFALTVFKSWQVTNEFVIKIVQLGLNTFKQGFSSCENALMTSIRHIEVTFINSLDFYVMVIVSRQFRKMIKQGFTASGGPPGA